MVDCQPLQGRSTAAAAPSDESTPLVHPPMVCKDDCPCFDDKPSYGATGDQPAQEDEAGNTVAKGAFSRSMLARSSASGLSRTQKG